MNIHHEFQVELGCLDLNNATQRNLARLLKKYESGQYEKKSPQTATRCLIEHYMAAVRSQNKLRRNWHPSKALACDLAVLEWIPKKNRLRAIISKRLQDALTVSTDGKRVILEDSLDSIADSIVEDSHQRTRKSTNCTELEEIVRRILKSNPDFTSSEVITEMRANPSEYCIESIDDMYVTIKIERGMRKDTTSKTRSLSSIKNIMTRIKTPAG